MSSMSSSRRRFLTGASLGALALPALPSLMREALAQSMPPRRRFIAITMGNGVRGVDFWPTVPDGAWRVRDAGQSVREVNLADLPAGPISPVLGPEFDPLRRKLTLVRGIDSVGTYDTHCPRSTLAGLYREMDPNRVSIDQIFADSARVYPSEPRLRSLHLAVLPTYQALTNVSFTGAGTAIASDRDPASAFRRLFGSMPMMPAGPDPRMARRVRALEHAQRQFAALRAQPRLSTADRRRLDEHMSMLTELGRRFAGPTGPGSGCTAPTLTLPPARGAGLGEPAGETHIPAYLDAVVALVAAAIKCDLTRVVVLQLTPPTDISRYSYLAGGAPGEHHGISHDFSPESYTKLRTINTFLFRFVARLLRELDTPEDASGETYLDRSLVYCSNECGAADRQSSHLSWAYPVLLAGGAAGALRQPGRMIDYRRAGTRKLYGTSPCSFGDDVGRTINQLLVTLCQSMGLAPSEYELQGQMGLGDYEGRGGNAGAAGAAQYNLTDRRAPLPFLQG